MTKYIIDDKVFESEQEVLEYVADEDGIDESGYDDELDEIYGDVEICGYHYSPSYALKEIDPIAYRCGFADWSSEKLEEMRGDLLEELERIDEGDEGFVGDYCVKVVNDCQDDDGEDDADIDEGGDEDET